MKCDGFPFFLSNLIFSRAVQYPARKPTTRAKGFKAGGFEKLAMY